MKIVLVGAGVSGLVSAYLLHREHDITVLEAQPRLGGHTHTVRVEHEGREVWVDTGFIVYNRRNYPLFSRLLRELDVTTHEAPMTFGVRDDATGLEYGGQRFGSLFAQKRNLMSPRFIGMIRDILRFNREAPLAAEDESDNATLGEFLARGGYGEAMAEQFLVPMAAAVWSAPAQAIREFPLKFFVRFFKNHGMLQTKDRPQWRTVTGGGRRYVERLTAFFKDRIRAGDPAQSIERHGGGAVVTTASGNRIEADAVVLACHSDEALALLADPSDAEREILGAMPYQMNDVVLHSDTSVLPRKRAAWSAWNYRRTADERPAVAVTYNMEILQSLGCTTPLLVTLNDTASIDPAKILGRYAYAHPAFSVEFVRAQERWGEISGGITHYCGACWRNGFHEDGVWSANRVAEAIAAMSGAGRTLEPLAETA